MSQVDKNRKTLLDAYPNIDAFKTEYHFDASYWEELKRLAETDSIQWSADEYEKSKDFLSIQLKALMARELYDMSAYFKIINEKMDIFKEGLRLIGNAAEYNRLLKPHARK